jgi:hypothetical protein
MADEIEGKESVSLPDATETTETGQESASPTESLTEQIMRKAAEAKGESAAPAAKEKEEKGKEKPPPYDQDPKWKKARAAEARVDAIVEKYGFDNIDELEAELDKGKTISQLIGERDAKKLIEDSQTLQKYREYWAEQKQKKQEEEETPEEKAERVSKELNNIKRSAADKERSEMEAKTLTKALEDYESIVGTVVGQHGFAKEESEMASLLLGVKNPFNVIDLGDKAAIKKMAKENTAKFKTFLDGIRQAAIDEYAKGKSKFIPISSTAAPAKESVSKKKLPENASVDSVFGALQKQLLDSIRGGANP